MWTGNDSKIKIEIVPWLYYLFKYKLWKGCVAVNYVNSIAAIFEENVLRNWKTAIIKVHWLIIIWGILMIPCGQSFWLFLLSSWFLVLSLDATDGTESGKDWDSYKGKRQYSDTIRTNLLFIRTHRYTDHKTTQTTTTTTMLPTTTTLLLRTPT